VVFKVRLQVSEYIVTKNVSNNRLLSVTDHLRLCFLGGVVLVALPVSVSSTESSFIQHLAAAAPSANSVYSVNDSSHKSSVETTSYTKQYEHDANAKDIIETTSVAPDIPLSQSPLRSGLMPVYKKTKVKSVTFDQQATLAVANAVPLQTHAINNVSVKPVTADSVVKQFENTSIPKLANATEDISSQARVGKLQMPQVLPKQDLSKKVATLDTPNIEQQQNKPVIGQPAGEVKLPIAEPIITVKPQGAMKPKPRAPLTGEDAVISKLEFKQANMLDVVRALADMSGLNIVATEDAAKKSVTVFLQNISVKDALDTITKNSGLWHRQDKVSKTFRIMTTEEYQRDVVVYREDTTRIFNLLHPNPTEVATVIRDIYNQRVIVSQLCDAGAVRKLGGSTTGNAGGVGGRAGVGAIGGRGGIGGIGGQANRNLVSGRNGRNQGMNNPFSSRVNDELTPDQLQMLDDATESAGGNVVSSESLRKVGSSEPLIFLSVNCEHNLIIIRTSDNAAIKDIEHLIKEMDRPVPQVLLEMKILELSAGDSFEQLFDVNYQTGDQTKGPGVFSTALPTLPVGTLSNAKNLTLGAGSLVYQFLSDKISAKIQLLQTKNKVKTISSPVLLASNNRKSELFVGTQNLITTGFNPGTVVTPANGAPTTVAPTPITSVEDVGPKLTITPKINADRTVTMEIDQSVTSIVRALSQVLVPDATGNLTQQFVDGLNVATINGIVTAKDGLTVAIGGLIKNSDSKVDTRVPVFSSIPLLGELFKGKKDVSSRTEMVLLITPHIISTAAESDDITRDVVEPMTEQAW
jgi:general secretion pathway protein D